MEDHETYCARCNHDRGAHRGVRWGSPSNELGKCGRDLLGASQEREGPNAGFAFCQCEEWIEPLSPKEKAKWQKRVDAAVATMDLGHIDMDPELLDKLAHLVAADALWVLDQMKKPGIFHETLLRKKDD